MYYHMSQNGINRNIISISPDLNGNLMGLKKRINVFLTDLKGNILIEQKNTEFIDITDQPKGHYIAFFIDVNGSVIKRIKVVKNI